jgi:pimeloyl-ACP methyl ester carboxylesterase
MGFSEASYKINGVETAVFTAGEGDPVVFFHGAGTATGFDCLLPLAQNNKLVIAHHPGYGNSGDPAFGSILDLARHQLDVIDRLGFGNFALVGHSMGGWTASTLATFGISRITKLVLVAPAGLKSESHPIVDMFAIPPSELLGYLAADMTIFGPMDGPPPPEFLDAREREMMSFAKVALSGAFDPELKNWLHRITIPTAILWGTADRIIPFGQAAEWNALLPNAKVSPFVGAGHLLLDERPDAIIAIQQFLAS